MAKKNKPPKLTHASFAAEHGLTIDAREVPRNPNLMEKWDADHWLVTLKLGRKKFEVYYSKGKGHLGDTPTLPEVLCCVALDGNTIESARSFEEWCGEFGYDIKANSANTNYYRQVYESCKVQSAKLKKFLGDEAYVALLACDEGE